VITTVARKLQVPAATTVVVLNRPAGIDLDSISIDVVWSAIRFRPL
jgi:hypothetical protein